MGCSQVSLAIHACPCGFQGHFNNKCRCTPDQINRYKAKISGPLLDRIDMTITVPALQQEELTMHTASESSAKIQGRVELARIKQLHRQGKPNADLGTKEIESYCQPDEAGLDLLKNAITRMNLSARVYHRILKLARTIADISGEADIQTTHIAEAIQYRRSE